MGMYEKWLKVVDLKNSVLCAGIDPAPFEMGRGEKGLKKGTVKRDWALTYLEAVAPFCGAVKPNLQYWKDPGDAETLEEIYQASKDMDILVIEDSKIADIGPTNDAGIYYTAYRADGVTFSPFAGNIGEACKSASAHGIGIIPMCLMSNPEYLSEKNKLVAVEGSNNEYRDKDLVTLKKGIWVRQYLHLAHQAAVLGADGVVVGAPSDQNHITMKDLQGIGYYLRSDMLILAPGIGAQGGEADALFAAFGSSRVIINVGRSLMLPEGSGSTPEDQAETAKWFCNLLNSSRNETCRGG